MSHITEDARAAADKANRSSVGKPEGEREADSMFHVPGAPRHRTGAGTAATAPRKARRDEGAAGPASAAKAAGLRAVGKTAVGASLGGEASPKRRMLRGKQSVASAPAPATPAACDLDGIDDIALPSDVAKDWEDAYEADRPKCA